MSKAVAALVINRNRYLIVKRTTGSRTGQCEFPGGGVDSGETEFEAVKRVVKEDLGVDIFPYQTAATLISGPPSGETSLTLIKCSIGNDVKSVLSNHASKYKWINIFDTADIALLRLLITEFLPI